MRTFTLIAAAALVTAAGLTHAADIEGLRFIDDFSIATGTQFDGTNVGGLSGIDFDPATGRYWAISDDRSGFNPARFYNLNVNFDLNSINSVNFNSRTNILRPDGTNFPTNQVDPEAIRFDPATNSLHWSSEGERNGLDLQNPFVREMNLDGTFVREFNTPTRYNPTAGPVGIRRNLAFESLTLSTDGATVYAATENALFQDGPAANLSNSSPCRVISYTKATGASGAEYVYVTDPVAAAPNPAGTFVTNGLVELLAITDTTFLAVERSFSTGIGNSIRIYKASLAGATDVSGFDALPGGYTAMTKELLFNVDSLGIPLDNIEGITLGPTLSNGSRSVLLVSDNNFSSTQFTQFLAFEVIPAPGSLAVLGLAVLMGTRRRR